MLRILTTIGANEATAVEPWQVFDPRVNRYWYQERDAQGRFSGQPMLVAEFMRFLEVLYCPENLTAHRDLIMSNLNDEDYQLILGSIPSEDYKYLAFGYGHNEGFSFCVVESGGYWNTKTLYNRAGASRVTLTQSNIRLQIEHIKTRIAAMMSSLVNAISQQSSCENMAGYLNRMMRHEGYLLSTDQGLNYTLGQVLSMQSYGITVSYSGGFPSIFETSVDGKSHLKKVFGYRADPRKLIREEITADRTHRDGRKHRRSPSEPLYGIELELSCRHTVAEMIDSQEFPFFLCKSDGSMSGSETNLYECVTVPMDRRSQRVAWGKFFAKFHDPNTDSYRGFDNSTQTNNGMHIHVTKAAFGSPQEGQKYSDHLRRFTWFFVDPFHKEFITAVSERGTELGSYAALPHFGSTPRKGSYDICVEMAASLRGAVNINTSSRKTIEIRIFKGIVSYATLLKNLEFVDAVFYFSQESNYSRLSIECFLEWLSKQPKTKYKALRLFLDKMDQSILGRVALMRRFQRCKTADEALLICSQLGEMDKTTLDFLNQRFRVRNQADILVLQNGKIVKNPFLYGLLRPHEAELNPFRIASEVGSISRAA